MQIRWIWKKLINRISGRISESSSKMKGIYFSTVTWPPESFIKICPVVLLLWRRKSKLHPIVPDQPTNRPTDRPTDQPTNQPTDRLTDMECFAEKLHFWKSTGNGLTGRAFQAECYYFLCSGLPMLYTLKIRGSNIFDAYGLMQVNTRLFYYSRPCQSVNENCLFTHERNIDPRGLKFELSNSFGV